MCNDGGHAPVMLAEALHALDPSADGRFIDCTYGRGGHARALLARLGPAGRLLGLDKDPEAVASGEKLAAKDRRFTIKKSSFGELERVAGDIFSGTRVNGVLFDLGVSSPQLDRAERGFSFQQEGPLDMRMDPTDGPSVAQWLRHVDERELTRVLRDFGEERYARRIARAILAERARSPIDTTMQLADIVKRASPTRGTQKHPATRSFQALRIRINDELGELERGLRAATDLLDTGGRLVVISFHSLEDRLVKRFIRAEEKPDSGPFPVPLEREPRLRALGRAVRPSSEECAVNPRARSAVLRAAQRLG